MQWFETWLRPSKIKEPPTANASPYFGNAKALITHL